MSPGEKVFPRWALEGCSTAICFFCAGFLGANVESFVQAAGIRAIGVDNDAEMVERMRPLYPDFDLVIADAYEHLDALVLQGAKFDLVTVDPPLGQMTRCFDRRHKFKSLARDYLVLGIDHALVPMARCDGARVEPRVVSQASWWATWSI